MEVAPLPAVGIGLGDDVIKLLTTVATIALLPTAAAAVQLSLAPANIIGSSGDYQLNNQFAAGSILDQQTGPIDETVQLGYWLNPDNGPAAAFLTVDLGAVQSLASLTLFNTHNAGYNDRGTGNFTITASNAVVDLGGGNFTLSGAVATIVNGTLTAQAHGTPLVGQGFTAAGSYRYLSFNPTSVSVSGTPCCGANVYGLNELRVFTTDVGVVPEPEAWALMLAGFAMIGLAQRRRFIATA